MAGGHKTAPPSSITYCSVVTREIFMLVFIIAGLNDLYICASDIGNACLNSNCQGKLSTEAGLEFWSDKGYTLLVVRALYGLNSSGEACRTKLAETLNSMGYSYTCYEPDVWIKRSTTENFNV